MQGAILKALMPNVGEHGEVNRSVETLIYLSTTSSTAIAAEELPQNLLFLLLTLCNQCWVPKSLVCLKEYIKFDMTLRI